MSSARVRPEVGHGATGRVLGATEAGDDVLGTGVAGVADAVT